ncbi:MAG: mannose-1-phosphate guanylyltransferase [Paludibacteraceae bacterium]|nr:mannose-1-phosphate guanylyltransferase [Paludibacteraceae bacterium]
MNSNNYCVIMAGGIGSRFWPYSRNSKPKQFLDFFGTGRSLLQMTFDRFVKVIPPENILIVSNKAYLDLILEQLPMIKKDQVLLEPVRRNTAPCIAYAAAKIYARNHDASMVVAPSDHLITKENEFLDAVTTGLDFVTRTDNMLTFGIKPNRPETGYGYIQTGTDVEQGIRKVKTFTEKPNLELAKVFVESGEFFWNSGVFLWSVKTIRKELKSQLPEIHALFEEGSSIMWTSSEQAFIDSYFPSCQNISIDYGVMEKAKKVCVLCGDFGWSDLGTWGSLYDMSEKNANGNVNLNSNVLEYDCKNNIVVMPKGKLAVLQGLDGYIVVETENSLLVCRKQDEQEIRKFVNDVSLLEENSKFV